MPVMSDRAAMRLVTGQSDEGRRSAGSGRGSEAIDAVLDVGPRADIWVWSPWGRMTVGTE